MAQVMDINHVFQERNIAGMALIPGAAVAESATGQIQKQGTVRTAGIGNDFSVTKSISLAEKVLLTLEEAALLTGIGQNKLREISNGKDCPFVLWNGSKRMFKREKLIGYLCSVFSI